jgi:enolase
LVGDEGGFAPAIEHASEAFDLIAEACDSAGYRFGDDIKLALDVAATEVYREGKYHLDGMAMDAATMVDFYESLVKKYPIISIEDPFAEDDFAAWKLLQERIGQQVQIVGDDLTVTNVQRMELVQNQKLVSAMIVKPNQIGTITQTMNAIKLANQYGWRTIISHRSGETEDTTIADIAYAVGSPYIKTGSSSRSERLAKYNRLIWLEQIV